jgi:hypothetical protein
MRRNLCTTLVHAWSICVSCPTPRPRSNGGYVSLKDRPKQDYLADAVVITDHLCNRYAGHRAIREVVGRDLTCRLKLKRASTISFLALDIKPL